MRAGVLVLSLAFYLSSAGAQISAPTAKGRKTPAEKDATIQKKLPREFRGLDAPAAAALPQLTDADRRRPKRGAHQIGVTRKAPESLIRTGKVGRTAAGRQVWVGKLHSAGASEIRVHFVNFDVGEGEVWLHASRNPDGPQGVTGPYTGRGIFNDGDFWSGAVSSDTVTIIYAVPAGRSVGAKPPFEIDQISHAWESGAKASTMNAAAASCNLDVTCYPDYKDLSSAIGRYTLIADDGIAYLCSGSLVNTVNSNQVPYFLTANHCVSTDREARSVQVYFGYQTSTCNGPIPNLATLPNTVGSGLLATAPFGSGDYTLIQLKAVPSDATFAGWTTEIPGVASQVIGIHHPTGSWKRISFGYRTGDQTAFIGSSALPAAMYYQVLWTQGVTEEGSSGSPLFNSNKQIVGTLTDGPLLSSTQTACDVTPTAGYGRFTNAFTAISQYLNDDPTRPLFARPTPMSFRIINGVFSGSQNLTISSVRSDAITFQASADQPWVKIGSTGTTSLATAASLPVSIDSSALTDVGVYNATITISGDGIGSLTVPVQVAVSVQNPKVSIAVDPNPVVEKPVDASGSNFAFTVKITEVAGHAEQITTFKLDGVDISASIANLFSSTKLDASATLSSVLLKLPSKPHDVTIEIGGTDVETKESFTSFLTVPFLSMPPLQMTVLPSLVRRNANDPQCPFAAYIQVQDQHNSAVDFTKFLAGSKDLTDSIGLTFGATHLPAKGGIQGKACWQDLPDSPMNLELDGTDETGATVSATATLSFAEAAEDADTLSVSPAAVTLDPFFSPKAQISVNVGKATTAWTATLTFQGKSGWAVVNPASGTGSARLVLTGLDSGLPDGKYQATLSIVAQDAAPQIINVPVTFNVGQ